MFSLNAKASCRGFKMAVEKETIEYPDTSYAFAYFIQDLRTT